MNDTNDPCAFPPGGASPCPSADALRLYATSDQWNGGAEEIRRHIASCPTCRQEYERFVADDQPSSDVRSEEEGTIDLPSDDDLSSENDPGQTLQWVDDATPDVTLPGRDTGNNEDTTHRQGKGGRGGEADRGAVPGGSEDRLGDYELQEEIGRGGMGVVYRAFQRSLRREVALKVIRSGPASHPEDLMRFRQEAEVAAQLNHSNIVGVYDVGEADGRHFFTMELINGQSLAEMIGEHPLSPQQAARYIRDVALAMHQVHNRGIVHRDLKPSNILIDADDRPRITDFGLAKRTVVDLALTVTGQFIGTPSYMAPEQVRGEASEINPRTDVYALGATLYETITGRPPFRAATLAETLDQVLRSEPASPRLLNAKIPHDLETICLKCLQKDPEQRYPTATEVADELECYLADRPIRARPVGRPARVWRWCRRNPTVAGLMGTICLLLVATLIGSTWAALHFQGMSEDLATALGDAEDQRDNANEATRKAQRERDYANTATREAKQNLFEAYLAQARASRQTGRPGQSLDSLEAVRRAVRLTHELNRDDQAILDLRNEAIAALGLPDVKELSQTTDRFQHFSEQRLLSQAGISPNFERAACWDYAESRFVILDTNNGAVVSTVPEAITNGAPPIQGVFSHDGSLLAFDFRSQERHQEAFCIWDVDGGRIVQELSFPGRNAAADALSFSHDDRLLAISFMDAVALVETAMDDAGEEPSVLEFPPGAAWGTIVEFHPRENQVAVAYRGAVEVRDCRTTQCLATIPLRDDPSDLAWDSTGQCLAVACASTGRIYLYDARLGHLLSEFEAPCWRLKFHPSGNYLATSPSHVFNGRDQTGYRKKTVIVNPWTGRRELLLSSTFLGFDPEGQRIVTIGESRDLHVWSFFSAATRLWPKEQAANRLATGTSYSAQHGFLALHGYAGTSFVDTNSGAELGFVPSAHGFGLVAHDAIHLYGISANNLTLWPMGVDGGGGHQTLTVGAPWTAALPEEFTRSPGETGRTYEGGQIALRGLFRASEGAQPAKVDLLITVDSQTQTISTETILVREDVVSPERQLLVRREERLREKSGTATSCYTVSATDGGDPLLVLPGYTPKSRAIFSPKGRWLLVSDQSATQVWDTRTWKITRVLAYRDSARGDQVSFSADGELAAAIGRDDTIKLYDANSWTEIASVPPPPGEFLERAWLSPDGLMLMATREHDHDNYSGAHQIYFYGRLFVWHLPALRQKLAEFELDWTGSARSTPTRGRIEKVVAMPWTVDELRRMAQAGEWNALLERLGSQAASGVREAVERNHELLRIRANAYLKTRRWDEAVADMDLLLDAIAGEPRDYLDRGVALANLQHWERAVADFRRAVELAPTNSHAWYCLAIAEHSRGEIDAYLEVCRGMLDAFHATKNVSDALNTVLAVVSFPSSETRFGKLDKLQRLAELVAAEHEGPPPFPAYLPAMVFYRQQKYEQARSAYTQAGERLSEGPWELFFEAMIRARLGELDQTEQDLKDIAFSFGEAGIYRNHLWTHRHIGQSLFDEAKRVLAEARGKSAGGEGQSKDANENGESVDGQLE